MKINRKTLLGISLGVVIVLSTFVTLYVVLRPKDQLIKHDAIIIWGDEDFELFDFPGDGNIDNPFLLQNYNITTDGKYGIFIRNTLKHFVIRNCYINAKDYGIYLENIADGSAIITDNICTDSEIGIYVSNSDNIIIENNVCKNNIGPIGSGIVISDSSYCNITDNYCTNYDFYGIRIEDTYSCYLFNNTCTENLGIIRGSGIYVFHSDKSRLVNNICNSNKWFGIEIRVSSYSVLINNTCVENDHIGIRLTSSPYTTITNNTCMKNRNWWKLDSHGINLLNSPFCYLAGNTISSNIGNGIFLESSSNCYITDNLIYDHTGFSDEDYSNYSTTLGHGVYCYKSSNTSILFNQDFNNYGSFWIESSERVIVASNIWTLSKNYTIEIYDGTNCSLQYNIFDRNKEGIHLTDTVSSNVTYNLIQNTESYGVSIFGTSSDNLVHHNSFINNNLGGTSQAYDEGIGNYWFDNVSKEGNFWTDFVSPGNYSIDGPSNSEDPYCLIEQPYIILLIAKITSVIQQEILTSYFELQDNTNFKFLFYCLFLSFLLKTAETNIPTRKKRSYK